MRKTSSERRSGKAVVWAIGVTVALVAGVAIGQYLLPSAAPPSLRTAGVETSFGVEKVSFDDARTVQLSLDISADQTLTFPTEGRVTQTSCGVGAQIISGQVVAEVNGKKLLALNTAIPLWESFKPGDEGEDVDALRQELARLGADLADSGPVNAAVNEAFAGLLSPDDVFPDVLEEVPVDQIMWIPHPSVTMLKCAAKVADAVKPGDEFGTVSGALTAARVAPLPDDLAAGARTITVAGLDLPVDESGEVTSPEALASLASSADYQALRSAAESSGADEPSAAARSALVAVFALTPQTTAWAVPASTVFGVIDDVGCITSKDGSLSVTIVGSSLGKTYVIPAQKSAAMPAKVESPVLKSGTCAAPK